MPGRAPSFRLRPVALGAFSVATPGPGQPELTGRRLYRRIGRMAPPYPPIG